MEDKKKLTLEVSDAFRQRLEAIARLKDMSVQNYCFLAIHKEVSEDEFRGATKRIPLAEAADYLRARQNELYGYKALPGDSAEDIRQAREERAVQIEEAW